MKGEERIKLIDMLISETKHKDIYEALNISPKDKSVILNINKKLKRIAKKHRSQFIENNDDPNVKIDEVFRGIKLSPDFIKCAQYSNQSDLKQYLGFD